MVLSQWTRAEVAAPALPEPAPEKFVPGGVLMRAVGVELKAQATVVGGQVKLKQIARWSETEAAAMQQVGDVVIGKLEGKTSRSLDIEDVKIALEQAGVNLASINFSGAMACKVTRSDAVLEQAPGPPVEPNTERAPQAGRLTEARMPNPAPALEGQVLRTLREILAADLARNLAVPSEMLEIRFGGPSEKVLDFTEPHFKFEFEPLKLRKLGDVSWMVTLVSPAGKQKATVSANVRMWENQLVTARPLAFKQPIGEEDLGERRVLVDRLNANPVLRKDQIIGQQAARDLSAGTVLNGRMIAAVEMARLGQLVTVTVRQGGVLLNWVAEARESGSLGQAIRVRKPGTREEFSVMLTGPQEGRLLAPAPASVAGRQ
jgi:flagella basal body P-ring formation protein FlgA